MGWECLFKDCPQQDKPMKHGHNIFENQVSLEDVLDWDLFQQKVHARSHDSIYFFSLFVYIFPETSELSEKLLPKFKKCWSSADIPNLNYGDLDTKMKVTRKKERYN